MFKRKEIVLTIAATVFAMSLGGGRSPAAIADREPATAGSTADVVSDLQSVPVQRTALRIARAAIAEYFRSGKTMTIPAQLPAALMRRSAVFVTIEKMGVTRPRGCRGTLSPATGSLAAEIVRNAVAAASRDNSQPPLRPEELPHCLISITVVLGAEPIAFIGEHDAAENGLIAESGNRIGIVLPYEGHDAVTQLRWALRKAGLPDGSPARLRELRAVRFRDTSKPPNAINQ